VNRMGVSKKDSVRGSALVPTLVVVSTLVVLSMALITTGMSGARTVNYQDDDYRLTSAVESAAMLAAEKLWTGYLQTQGGEADDIISFRNYLTAQGIVDMADDIESLPPDPDEVAGVDLLELSDLPEVAGAAEFNEVNIDAIQVVRVDVTDSTQLYLTVSASTKRGEGMVNPVLNRAVQQVYTVEPDAFSGFDYGILANNVNCIFCHTQVDRVERFYNPFDENYGNFEKVKVGTLESLMIRHNMYNSNPNAANDYDSDSYIAGSLYVRGHAMDHQGYPINDWGDLTFGSFQFDDSGLLAEDFTGMMNAVPFSPASGTPQAPGENLYLNYPSVYSDMPDGNLPLDFPPPFPDDGGFDPNTHLPSTVGAGNNMVDDFEFYAAAEQAEGAITAGIITKKEAGDVIDNVDEYAAALFSGNLDSIQQSEEGNFVLTGMIDPNNPDDHSKVITIDGTVAIDGDLIINGYVKGSGSLLVRGNVYIPTDLQYLDGTIQLDGGGEVRTFGTNGGVENSIGIAAGGNVMIGDFLKPSGLQPDGSYALPGDMDIVSGSPEDEGDAMGSWSYTLAELSLFNRGEWAKTQTMLPGEGEANLPSDQWTVSNLPEHGGTYVAPEYDINGDPVPYVPRYYNFGPGDEVPIYNLGVNYWDPDKGAWIAEDWSEVPMEWIPELVTMADPNDPNDPILFGAGGNPIATISQLTSTNSWITDEMYKLSLEYFENNRPAGPMAIDGLLYTNNAIFGLVHRFSGFAGQMIVNGALVCADLGLLVPGHKNSNDFGTANNVPGSNYAVGLRLNYDERVRNRLNVINPNQVQMKRTLWNPTANLL